MNTNRDFDLHVALMFIIGPMILRYLLDSPQTRAAIVGEQYEQEQQYFDREFKLIVESYE